MLTLPDVVVTPHSSGYGVSAKIPYACGHSDNLFFAGAEFVCRNRTDTCLDCHNTNEVESWKQRKKSL